MCTVRAFGIVHTTRPYGCYGTPLSRLSPSKHQAGLISQTKYRMNCSLVTSRALSRSSAAKTRAPRFGGVAGEPRVRVAPFLQQRVDLRHVFHGFQKRLELDHASLVHVHDVEHAGQVLDPDQVRLRGFLLESRRRRRRSPPGRRPAGRRAGRPARRPGPAERRACVGLGPLACSSEPAPASETAARAIAARCFWPRRRSGGRAAARLGRRARSFPRGDGALRRRRFSLARSRRE